MRKAPPQLLVFLNSKDVALQSCIGADLFSIKKKQVIVSDNSLTLVRIVLAEAKKHYNKELEQKMKLIFHTDDSTSYKVVRRLASACKKSKKTRDHLTSCNFTFTNTTALAVRTAAEEFCFAVCNDPVDECPSCNIISFTLTPYKDVLATLSSKNAVYIKSDESLSLLSKETEAWAAANSIPTFIFDQQEEAFLPTNYKKVFLQGSDPGLESLIIWLNTENYEGEVFIIGPAAAVDLILLPLQLVLKQVKSGSKFNAASIQYSQLSNFNYDKNLAATVEAAIQSLRWQDFQDFPLSHPG
jgi:hypothetical protein